MIQNQNLIGILQGGNTVGDDENGVVAFQVFQLFLYVGFRFHIHSGRGVIQYEDRRILQQGTGQGDTLLLAAGKADAPFPHDGIIAWMKWLASAAMAAFFTLSNGQSGRA